MINLTIQYWKQFPKRFTLSIREYTHFGSHRKCSSIVNDIYSLEMMLFSQEEQGRERRQTCIKSAVSVNDPDLTFLLQNWFLRKWKKKALKCSGKESRQGDEELILRWAQQPNPVDKSSDVRIQGLSFFTNYVWPWENRSVHNWVENMIV